jgi:hypothetical protein
LRDNLTFLISHLHNRLVHSAQVLVLDRARDRIHIIVRCRDARDGAENICQKKNEPADQSMLKAGTSRWEHLLLHFAKQRECRMRLQPADEFPGIAERGTLNSRGYERGGARDGPTEKNEEEMRTVTGNQTCSLIAAQEASGGTAIVSEPDVWCCTH